MLQRSNFIQALLCLLLCLSLQACHKKEEFTEYIPAKLELEWQEEVNKDDAIKGKFELSEEMKQKLLKIGEFKYTSVISLTSEKHLLTHKILFLREIKTDEVLELGPLIQEICKGKQFTMTSHGAITKKSVRETYGFSWFIF